MARKPVSFKVVKSGRTYSICSDSEAAMVTGGVAMTGLDLADVRKIVAGLRKHGKKVDFKE